MVHQLLRNTLLYQKLYGSDAKHSMEQKEFKFYVDTIKDIWKIKNTKIDKIIYLHLEK